MHVPFACALGGSLSSRLELAVTYIRDSYLCDEDEVHLGAAWQLVPLKVALRGGALHVAHALGV